MTESEFEDMLENAMLAFWNVITERNPTIKTGDIAPDDYIRFHDECQLVVEQWLIDNK